MPNPIFLDEAVEAILDSIVSSLREALAPGEILEGVKSVNRGGRANTGGPPPNLWVFPEVAIPENDTRALAETWRLPVVFTSVVKSVNDAETGERLATRYAARARSVVIRDRRLGLPNYVQDVVSARFEPSAPWHSDPQSSLYGAVAAVNVVFRIFEVYN